MEKIEEEQHAKEQNDRFEAIKNMIKEAHKNSLLIEVIMSYGQFKLSGDSDIEAAYSALYEWDC